MSKLKELELMEKILEVRFSDLEKEKELCLQLLNLAETEQYVYGVAFANVYLTDSFLALGKNSSCDFYLSRSVFICRENGFDDLLLILCNLAGLHFLKLNDEQTALEYYLEGLRLAKKLGDVNMSSKLNNNIGLGFAGRNGWPAAKQFFKKAYKELSIHMDDKQDGNMISYVVNLSEIYKELGDLRGEKEMLELCDNLSCDDLYYQIRIGCGWCSYFAMNGEKEKAITKIEELLALGMQDYDNAYFVRDMLIGLADNMLHIAEYTWTGKLIQILDELSEDAPLIVKYRTQCLRIQYFEAVKEESQLTAAYKDYYQIVEEMAAMDNQVRVQSLLSKIQLEQSLLEREAIKKEKVLLENASQADELTGLYNRRYLNKLVSKASHNKAIKTMAFIMLDVDYFKSYNDFYGHFEGDKALKKVAQILKDCACDGIYPGRYGGDEFVSICLNIADEGVDAYVTSVMNEVKKANLPHAKSKCGDTLTVSMGYCNMTVESAEDAERTLQLADEALYQVKEAGRDNFVKVSV